MEFIRISDKVICTNKIERKIKKILELRCKGLSQQEVADKLKTHRTFISRIESIGEIRKGKTIAVVGFPIKNKEEIKKMLFKEGIEFQLILSNEERWDFVDEKSGIELFNEVMEIITKVRSYDIVIVIGSDERVRIVETLLDNEVISLNIGESPINEDKYIEPARISKIIRSLKEE